MNSRAIVVGTALAVMAGTAVASAQTRPTTVAGLVSAAKNAAGLDWAGTFLRLCVVPPPAAPGAAGAANGAPVPPAKASWYAEPAKVADNFLKGPDGFWLVDYEYSGMGDPFFDLGNLSINNGLSEASQERLLELMFGEPTDAHRARLQLMRIMSDFREAMWGVIQQGLSTLDIDYVAYADRHFDRLSRSMADDRFEGWLEQAAEAV